MAEPKAAPDYRALLEAHVVTQEGTALLRAALENVYRDHRCCGEDLRCPMAKAALERLWNAIK